jgi:uncharacterized protein YprB with RNaseH-like and TPR domain
MKKLEIIARDKFRCPLEGHGHKDGWEHPRCFEKFEQGMWQEKLAFFDIEAEDLDADYGIMFNWCLIDEDGKKYEDAITLADINKYKSNNREIQPKEDTRIVQHLINVMTQYTKVVAHYGSRYDLPFLRTRAVICGIDFPAYGMLFQADTWMMLKNKFCLRKNTLENGCRQLVGKTRKDHLSLSIKHGCLRGEKWAIDISKKHCEKDVLDLMALFDRTYKYVKKTNTSI